MTVITFVVVTILSATFLAVVLATISSETDTYEGDAGFQYARHHDTEAAVSCGYSGDDRSALNPGGYATSLNTRVVNEETLSFS